MAGASAEPTVLTAAKDALYPDLDTSPEHYAVTETQLTQSTWGGREVPDDLRRCPAQYNTIRLTGGEPDLLGVGMPTLEVLNDAAGTTPISIIEGKGNNDDSSTPTSRRLMTDSNSVACH